MCGRYSLATTTDELVEVFDVAEAPAFDFGLPRWNIAPTQDVPTLVLGREGRRLGPLRWGLVPFWADDPSIGNRLINARSETAHEKPAFREAFPRRRCLVPADGFYEWKRPPEGKGPRTPYWIHAADGHLLTLAGLWERWRPPEGEPLHTFTILTTRANRWMEPIHGRMPVVVAPEDRNAWMDRDTPVEAARELLGPAPEGLLAAREVSTHVNKPENDDPACVEPVGPD
ncbi:MAG TPA: SOS response-associated peptidase [Longimicrobiales bacterium]|nr:SOS response-associated peptidase [Longimicrobiales bacterium]